VYNIIGFDDMTQHFLLSRAAKTLTLVQVMRMTEEEAETMFRRIRWADTNGEPVCPKCNGLVHYNVRRPKGPARWRCKACNKEFTITSGTLFAWHKMPLQTYLAAIAIFVNEVKGKAALALSRDLGTSYKTAFVLAHKLREAMAAEIKGTRVGGEGETVEIDGMYVGGYVKPANLKENRVDRRLAKNQNGKRQVVVVARERGGSTLPAVFKSESAALGWLNQRVAKGTKIVADEAPSWNALHTRYEVDRIDHSQAYSLNGVYSNGAESFFSRMRRGEIGHFHHISGPYLVRYSQEAAWREDNRRVSNGDQTRRTVALALSAKPSVDFCGYWQRHKVAIGE
jgi:transposase-like protein